MNENEQEVINSTNDTETTENTEATEDIDSLPEWAKKRIETTEAQKNHWKDKATKKPEPTVEKKVEVQPKTEVTLSPKDYLALTESKISSDDFDEVVRVANILGKPVNEALKDSTLKAIIAGRVEERQTALATQTKSPRGTSRVSGDALMEKASKGELPEKDEDIAKLAEAEEAAKKARLRR